uniref:C2H2-type domain-containing protein n=1 Tax=Ascaris lumbricoides TaxID=6252 RepID=A0A0M3I0N8_ASCLU
MSINNECANSNSSIIRVDDLHSDQQPEVNLHAGTILGPFTMCNLTDNDDFVKNTESNDIVGRLKLCSLDENNSKEPKIIGIATTTATSNANCELFKSDKNLYLRVNRSVQKISDLKANVCSLLYAQQSDVSSNENGSSTVSESLVHVQGGQDVPKPSTSRDVSFVAMAPHAIYLPVAYHDSAVSHIQVLGYPQIIIPVAINRTTAHLHTPSLLVDETLSRGLEMPSSLSVGGILLKVDKMAHPTSCTPEVVPESISAFQPLKSKLSIPSRVAMKRHSPSSDNKPLDLSLHIKEKRCAITTKHESSSTENSSNESEKRYRCQCGVSFNSETTLQGHRKYYCNSVANHAEIIREQQKKTVIKCQQCGFQPASANQLAQHIRAIHSTIRTYVCQLCGYKGYSQRGIRSHLRTHSEYSNNHGDELIKRHVFVITTDATKFECVKCGLNFATKHLMKDHICDRTLKRDLST